MKACDLGGEIYTERIKMLEDRDLGWEIYTERIKMLEDHDLGGEIYTEMIKMLEDRDLGGRSTLKGSRCWRIVTKKERSTLKRPILCSVEGCELGGAGRVSRVLGPFWFCGVHVSIVAAGTDVKFRLPVTN